MINFRLQSKVIKVLEVVLVFNIRQDICLQFGCCMECGNCEQKRRTARCRHQTVVVNTRTLLGFHGRIPLGGSLRFGLHGVKLTEITYIIAC